MHKQPLPGIISSGRNYQRRLTAFCFSSFLYHSLFLAVPPRPPTPGDFHYMALLCDDSVPSFSCVCSPLLRAPVAILDHVVQAILDLFN